MVECCLMYIFERPVCFLVAFCFVECYTFYMNKYPIYARFWFSWVAVTSLLFILFGFLYINHGGFTTLFFLLFTNLFVPLGQYFIQPFNFSRYSFFFVGLLLLIFCIFFVDKIASKFELKSSALKVVLNLLILLSLTASTDFLEHRSLYSAQAFIQLGLGIKKVHTSSEIIPSWKKYESPEYNISFLYPVDWSIQDNSYVSNGKKYYNFKLISPSRTNLQGYEVIKIHYELLISEGNDPVGGFATDIREPGQQSPWNVDLGELEAQNPEYSSAQTIIASISRTR
jgi:hypothetical protein